MTHEEIMDFSERAMEMGRKEGRDNTIYQLREYIVESLCPLAIKYFDEAVERLKEQNNEEH